MTTTATKRIIPGVGALTTKALQELKIGNTQIAEVLTNPLHSTHTLTTGEVSSFAFFDKNRAEMNGDIAATNNTQGNRVPAKQAWIVSGIRVSIFAPTIMTDAALAALNEMIYNSAFIVKKDDSTKLETTLSGLLGADYLVQPAAATGANVMGGIHTGIFKLNEPLNFGAETQFEIYTENKTTGVVPASLSGVKIRVELIRKFVRLVA